MKILFCNFEYPPLGGGGGISNALLAEELVKKHEVSVLTSGGFDLPQETIENGVRVIRVPVMGRGQKSVASLRSMAFYILQGLRYGLALLKRESFDVINTHFVLPTGPVGHGLARAANLPNVLTLVGGDLYDPSKFTSPHRHALLRMTVRYLLRQAHMVIGDSDNTLENARKYYLPDMNGLRIPLAIKRPTIRGGNRQDYGIGEDEIILTTIGRLVPRKAVDQLIGMMKRFHDLEVRLLVIGNGPERESLENMVAASQLQKQVSFLGFVSEEEKYRLLGLSDIFVSTSQHEGFGLVFLEGMASALPIVCYDAGGQTDFLEDGKTGYLVPLNDLDTFSRRCAELVENSEKRAEMAQTNLKKVEGYFIETCATRYSAVFEQAVASFAGRESPILA